MKNIQINQQGYSLIELMVVVGISSVLSFSIVAVLQASSQGQRVTQRSSQEQELASTLFKALYQAQSCDLEGDTNADGDTDDGCFVKGASKTDANHNSETKCKNNGGVWENPNAFFVRPSFSHIMNTTNNYMRKNSSMSFGTNVSSGTALSSLSSAQKQSLRKELNLGNLLTAPYREKATVNIGGLTLTQGSLLEGHTSICVGPIRLRLPFDSNKYKERTCTPTPPATNCPAVTMFRTPIDYIVECDEKDEPGCKQSKCLDKNGVNKPTLNTKATCENNPLDDNTWAGSKKWLPGYNNDGDANASDRDDKYPGYRYNLTLEVTLYYVQKWSDHAQWSDCSKITESADVWARTPPSSIKIKKIQIPVVIHDASNEKWNSCQAFYRPKPALCPQQLEHPILIISELEGGEKQFSPKCPSQHADNIIDVGEPTAAGDKVTLYGGSYSLSSDDNTCLEGNSMVKIAWGSDLADSDISAGTVADIAKITDHPDDDTLKNDCDGKKIKNSSTIKGKPGKCNVSKEPVVPDKVALCACPKGYGYDANFDGDLDDSGEKGSGNTIIALTGKQGGFDSATAPAAANFKLFQCSKVVQLTNRKKESAHMLCQQDGECARAPMICTQYCKMRCFDGCSKSGNTNKTACENAGGTWYDRLPTAVDRNAWKAKRDAAPAQQLCGP